MRFDRRWLRRLIVTLLATVSKAKNVKTPHVMQEVWRHLIKIHTKGITMNSYEIRVRRHIFYTSNLFLYWLSLISAQL